MKLAQYPKKARYTLTEYNLFSLLPKSGRKVGSADILKAREALGEWDVRFPLKNVTVHMNRLIDKIEINREPFCIHKDAKRPGHSEVEYSLKPRNRNGK